VRRDGKTAAKRPRFLVRIDQVPPQQIRKAVECPRLLELDRPIFARIIIGRFQDFGFGAAPLLP